MNATTGHVDAILERERHQLAYRLDVATNEWETATRSADELADEITALREMQTEVENEIASRKL